MITRLAQLLDRCFGLNYICDCQIEMFYIYDAELYTEKDKHPGVCLVVEDGLIDKLG